MAESILEKFLIFISVGTQLPFDRLVKMVDKVLGDDQRFELFYQVGKGGYQPASGQSVEFVEEQEYTKLLERCSIFISHCGTGSMVSSVLNQTPLICVPRLAANGEHRNNHQKDVADKLDRNIFLVCETEGELADLVELALTKESVATGSLINKKFMAGLQTVVDSMTGAS